MTWNKYTNRTEVTPGDGDTLAESEEEESSAQPSPGSPAAGFLRTLSEAEQAVRMQIFDTECRKNAFLFHNDYFVKHSIGVASPEVDPNKIPAERRRLCTHGKKWYRDTQYRFLWELFLPWCKEFIADDPQILELCALDLTEDENGFAAVQVVDILTPYLNKAIIQAV